ncbi:hypothetical protein [Marivivens aquimaris]|uniref:hypothetical protein n=1 Tax=Marivivens aquimaris TaxID=2774876 RepID=UPI00187E624F|nr:hypothetical protein [Marivivens aquimaris]
MTLPGPQTLMIISGGVALFVVLLTAITIRRVRAKAAAASAKAQAREEQLIEQIDVRLAAYAGRIEAMQAQTADRIHDDIRGLQSDMDWLAGERMIDEAINMARTGQQAKDISVELGLPLDAAEAISRFRKH